MKKWAGIALLLLIFSLSSANAQQEQDSDAAQQIIEEVNQWRMDNGLWPLKPNLILERMAIDQAIYVLTES
ncbi:MAG: hypothetical protein K8L99_36100, partial [Anaerolineae bacterium]|nr:hypothetical protein [Anaerolineae bacterium]